ncbi:MAG: T9SS type A sorting domain-containing protein [Bacteroidia bacterium]
MIKKSVFTLWAILLFANHHFAQSRLDLNSDIFYSDTIYSNNNSVWLKISLSNSSNIIAQNVTLSAIRDSSGIDLLNDTMPLTLGPFDQLDTLVQFAPNTLGSFDQLGRITISAITTTPGVDPAYSNYELVFVNLPSESAFLSINSSTDNDTFKTNEHYPLNLTLKNKGKVDFYRPEGINLAYSINGSPTTSFFSAYSPLLKQGENQIDILDSIAIDNAYLKKGGGNIIVVWPVGFAKVDSIIDTIYVDWPESTLQNFTSKTTIHPNPAANYLYINNNKAQFEQVRIISASGKEVLNTPNREKIDISHIKSGIYLIEIKGKNKVFRERIIIE